MKMISLRIYAGEGVEGRVQKGREREGIKGRVQSWNF
jgi:hypothetical protein